MAALFSEPDANIRGSLGEFESVCVLNGEGFIEVLLNTPKLSQVFVSGYVNTKRPFSTSFRK